MQKKDLIIALIFGCVVFLLCFQFQSTKKNNRSSYKKETQKFYLSSLQDTRPHGNIYAFNFKHTKKSKSDLQKNRAIASFTVEEKYEEYESGNPENEFSDEEAKAQMDSEMSLQKTVKLENYLFTQIGLTASEISRVLDAKRHMEDDVLRNKSNQSLSNSNDEFYTDLNLINQQILFNYQEELKQILGLENYQRYSIWQSEQDAALSDSYAGGKTRSMDEI